MATTGTTATSASEAFYASLAGNRTNKASAMAEAEDRFLTLLTTQLKNQDPLNPLDNAQLTSQLAQISTVNGIEKLNASLQKLLSNMTDTQALQAAAMVNRSVLAPGTSLTLGESGGSGGFELATGVDDLTITIKDANGLVMRTLSLGAQDAGIHQFVWDGKTDSGAQAAPGNYSFSLAAKRGGEAVTATALAYGLVQAVTNNNGVLTLDVGRLGAFSMSDIRRII